MGWLPMVFRLVLSGRSGRMIIKKQSVSDLAILGGEPAFKKAVHVGEPNIGDRERFIALVNDMLDRRQLTNNGPYVRELEERLAALLGVGHCVLVSSGTDGLILALRALELSGEVIVPAMTFIATVHALHWLGLQPIFADVDPVTHQLNPACVESLITDRTRAILGVHLWGQPCAVEELTAIAQAHDLKLIFDAAHAFCCHHQGKMIGNFGNVEVFSFHATKFFNTFEGGALTTNDGEIAHRARLLRNFGFVGVDQVATVGINAKLPEVSAAMGLTLLDSLPELLERNRSNYQIFEEALANIPGIRLLRYPDIEANNCQYIVIEVDGQVISRDLLVSVLREENILARRYFYPGCHRMEPYRTLYPPQRWHLPVTETLVNSVASLPSNATYSTEQILAICEVVQFIVANAAGLRRQLSS